MKKVVLVLAIIAVAFGAQAQVKFGVNAGVVSSSAKLKSDGETQFSESKIGFTLGALADISINENFVFQPALNFVQKGGKDEETESGVTVKSTIAFSYVELPLNFVYRSAPESGFFAGLGPVIGFGVGGKQKYKVSGGGLDEEEEEDINFGSGDEEVKPLEFGGNILAGYQLPNGLFFAANYNIGFSNLLNNPTDGASFKNSYIGLKVGFKFGGSGGSDK